MRPIRKVRVWESLSDPGHFLLFRDELAPGKGKSPNVSTRDSERHGLLLRGSGVGRRHIVAFSATESEALNPSLFIGILRGRQATTLGFETPRFAIIHCPKYDDNVCSKFLSVPGAEQLQKLFLRVTFSAKPAQHLTTTPKGKTHRRKLRKSFSLGVRAIFWAVKYWRFGFVGTDRYTILYYTVLYYTILYSTITILLL